MPAGRAAVVTRTPKPGVFVPMVMLSKPMKLAAPAKFTDFAVPVNVAPREDQQLNVYCDPSQLLPVAGIGTVARTFPVAFSPSYTVTVPVVLPEA